MLWIFFIRIMLTASVSYLLMAIFTRLASRLRESGMDVIGMGESKTPRSFRAACSVFTDLELLREQAHEDEPDSKPVKKTERSNIIKQSKIENCNY